MLTYISISRTTILFPDEKKLTQLYSQDDFVRKQFEAKTADFRRQQSAIYRSLHPQKVGLNIVICKWLVGVILS